MTIMRGVLGTIIVLLELTAAMSMAEAGQGGYRYHRYGDHSHTRDGYDGWRGLRLFGFGYDGAGVTGSCVKPYKSTHPIRVIGTDTTRALASDPS